MKDIKQSHRYKLLIDSLDRLEHHKYCPISISWCSDTIGWMDRFHRLPKEEIENLADRVTNIIKGANEHD